MQRDIFWIWGKDAGDKNLKHPKQWQLKVNGLYIKSEHAFNIIYTTSLYTFWIVK